MPVSSYFLGSWKDGQFDRTEELREKSETGRLVIIHEDNETKVYEDSDLVDVAKLYGEACGQYGMYVMRETGCKNENDRCFEAETSDTELYGINHINAYDDDGDVVYSVSYFDHDDRIFDTSELIGLEAAMKALIEEMGGDEDVVRICVLLK